MAFGKKTYSTEVFVTNAETKGYVFLITGTFITPFLFDNENGSDYTYANNEPDHG